MLAFRGDYDKQISGSVIRMCVDIEFNADGSFKEHTFADIPLTDVETRIRRLAQMLGVSK